jgi:hypothetical protein
MSPWWPGLSAENPRKTGSAAATEVGESAINSADETQKSVCDEGKD